MTNRRLFDQLDIGSLRHAAKAWDVLALLVIALAVAAIPVILVLLGHTEE